METTTHTPGPWKHGETTMTRGRIYGGGVLVATLDPAVMQEEVAIKEADARLIAAAPDLLLQLKEARQYIAKVATNIALFASIRLDRMDAAIAKAEGGEAENLPK